MAAPPITHAVTLPDRGRMLLGDWPGGGPTVIAIAGLTGHHRVFSGIAEALGGEQRIVALDLRGRGCSTSPARPGIKAHARDVLTVMDVLGIQRVLLAGHSMGAYVAAEVARQAPERVLGVAMLDGGTPLDRGDDRAAVRGRVEDLRARLSRAFTSVDDYVAAWRAVPGIEAGWGPLLEDNLRYDLRPTRGGYALKADVSACVADLWDVCPAATIVARLREMRCPISAIGAEYGLAEGSEPALGEAGAQLLHELGNRAWFTVVPATNHITVVLSPHGAAACAAALTRLAAQCV